jgi:hypothetical protein
LPPPSPLSTDREQLGEPDPAQQASPRHFLPEDEGRSSLRNVVIFKVLKFFKTFKKQTMAKVQNKETSNIKLSPKTLKKRSFLSISSIVLL